MDFFINLFSKFWRKDSPSHPTLEMQEYNFLLPNKQLISEKGYSPRNAFGIYQYNLIQLNPSDDNNRYIFHEVKVI